MTAVRRLENEMIDEVSRAAGPRAPAPPRAGEATVRFLAATERPVLRPVNLREATGAYKLYEGAERVALPTGGGGRAPEPGPALTGRLMRGLLGLVRVCWTYPGPAAGEPGGAGMGLRLHHAVPSGGALYPIEAYLAGGSHGFPAGLHHYDRAHHVLQRVRGGDHRAALTGALAEPPGRLPDLVIVLTAVFWRTGVKYGDFAYRLQCQETGALAAQALVLAGELGLSARLHLDFDGRAIERLLDLPEGAEGVLGVLGLTARPRPESRGTRTGPSAGELIRAPAARVRRPPPSVAGSLPYLWALHTAGTAPRRLGRDRVRPGVPGRPPVVESAVRLPPPPVVRLRDGIARRRSAPAGFEPSPIAPDELAGILAAATLGHPGDPLDAADGPAACAVHVWVLRVRGVAPGVYRYDRAGGRLCPVAPARSPAAVAASSPAQTRLSLGEAAAVVIPAGDPLAGLSRFGDLWFRVQQVEAGLVVHRATLAAAALGLAVRIHSDVCTAETDAALGLTGSGRRGLSALLVGRPPRRTPVRWDPRPAAGGPG